MYTNGLNFWAEVIEGSEVPQAFYIQDICLSKNQSTLLVYCTVNGLESEFMVKLFHYDPVTHKFNLNELSN